MAEDIEITLARMEEKGDQREAKIDEMHLILFGNGAPADGLIHRFLRLEEKTSTAEKYGKGAITAAIGTFVAWLLSLIL